MKQAVVPITPRNVPPGWQIIRFTDAFTDRTGGQRKIKKGEYLLTGIFPVIDQGQEPIGGFTDDPKARCNVPLPCLLFGDHTKIIKYCDFPFSLGADGVKVLEPRADIDARFAFHYVSALPLPTDAGYSRHFKFLKRTWFPLPPLPEQRRIAAILDKADAIRRKRQQTLDLADQFLRSAFLDMFGDLVTNPKGWPVRKLGDVLTNIDGGWSPKCESRSAEADEWGVLKLGAVSWGFYKPQENKAMESATKPRRELEVQNGDLLFTRKNTYELVGASAYVFDTRPHLTLPDLVFRLALSAKANPIYIWMALSHPGIRARLRSMASGSAGSMPNISKTRLRELHIPLPPVEYQIHLRDIVTQHRGAFEQIRVWASVAEQLRASLVQRAFQGEL